MDGDTTQITEQSDQKTPEAPEASDTQLPGTEAQEQQEQPHDQVTAEQLCGYVQRVSFATTLGRRGYQQSDVDALVVKLIEGLRAGDPLVDLVRRTELTPVRLEDGYDKSQVDDFLAAVLDLDPLADLARPEVARSGFIAKLFG